MAYQKQYKSDSRRCYRSRIDPKDGEKIYEVISNKIKDRRFARPIILTAKQATEEFLAMWRANGWTEGDEW